MSLFTSALLIAIINFGIMQYPLKKGDESALWNFSIVMFKAGSYAGTLWLAFYAGFAWAISG